MEMGEKIVALHSGLDSESFSWAKYSLGRNGTVLPHLDARPTSWLQNYRSTCYGRQGTNTRR